MDLTGDSLVLHQQAVKRRRMAVIAAEVMIFISILRFGFV